MLDMFRVFWPVVLAFIGFLVWLIRLESRSIENGREIERLWKQRKEDLASSLRAREDTNEMLKEIRADIKLLMSKMGD